MLFYLKISSHVLLRYQAIMFLVGWICCAKAMTNPNDHNEFNSNDSSRVLASDGESANTGIITPTLITVSIVCMMMLIVMVFIYCSKTVWTTCRKLENSKNSTQHGQQQGVKQLDDCWLCDILTLEKDDSTMNRKTLPATTAVKSTSGDQTVADASIYTTPSEPSPSLHDIEADIASNRTILMIDGISVLSYLESAQNAYDDLSPTGQMYQSNCRQDDSNNRIDNTVMDGKSLETLNPSFLSMYGMDQFYPDDDEITNYRTAPPTTISGELIRSQEYLMSILCATDEVDSKLGSV